MTEEQRDDYVLNQGVKKLVQMDEDFKYTGHPVTAALSWDEIMQYYIYVYRRKGQKQSEGFPGGGG